MNLTKKPVSDYVLQKIALDNFHKIKKEHTRLIEEETNDIIETHNKIIDRAWQDYLKVKENGGKTDGS